MILITILIWRISKDYGPIQSKRKNYSKISYNLFFSYSTHNYTMLKILNFQNGIYHLSLTFIKRSTVINGCL